MAKAQLADCNFGLKQNVSIAIPRFQNLVRTTPNRSARTPCTSTKPDFPSGKTTAHLNYTGLEFMYPSELELIIMSKKACHAAGPGPHRILYPTASPANARARQLRAIVNWNLAQIRSQNLDVIEESANLNVSMFFPTSSAHATVVLIFLPPITLN